MLAGEDRISGNSSEQQAVCVDAILRPDVFVARPLWRK